MHADSTSAERQLSDFGISYELIIYEAPSLGTDGSSTYGQRAAENMGLDPTQVAKTLLLYVGKVPTLLVLPVEKKMDKKRVSELFAGKYVQFVPNTDVETITGYIPGGVSPFGLKACLQTVLDESLIRLSKIAVSAGKPGRAIAVNPESIVSVCSAIVAPVSK